MSKLKNPSSKIKRMLKLDVKSRAEKIANKIWDRYENGDKTFSHSLSIFSKKHKTLAIDAMMSCPRDLENGFNPTREQFVSEFVKIYN